MDLRDIRNAVARLSGGEVAERESAERYLRQLSPDDIREVLAWSRASESSQILVNSCSGCTLVSCGLPGIILAISMVITMLTKNAGAVMGVAAAAVPLSVAYGARKLIKSRQVTVEAEAFRRIENPLTCVPMLEGLFITSYAVRLHATEALRRLLPKLAHFDSGSFTRSARAALNRIAMSSSFDTEFVLIAVEALGKVGDESSAQSLELMLREAPYGSREKQIHAAAEIALPVLRDRIKERRQANTLLRAAQDESTDSLLRVVETHTELDPTVLLRPTEDGDR